MGAIQSHSTATSDGSWDGPANEARLRNDENAAYYRKAFAWVEDDGGDTKSDYKFIHHEVSSDGEIGAANVKACQTGIGVLNGGRGGTTIPEADREGVYNHLARHLRDADVEPPDLRAVTPQTVSPDHEIRAFAIDGVSIERRAEGDEESLRLSGYAAVFNRETDIAGIFTEVIRPGAFGRAVEDGQDVALLFNHDPSTVMARTTNGTLVLREDNIGLWFEAELDPRDQDAQRVVTKVERGNVSQGSFAFNVTTEPSGEAWDFNQEPPLRELLNLDLFDVSPVTYPAYSDTQVFARGRVVAPPTPDAQQPPVGTAGQQLRHQRRRIDIHKQTIEKGEI